MPLLNAAVDSNKKHIERVYELLSKNMPAGGRVLLCGIGFKSGVSTGRDSPLIELADALLRGHFELAIYDPYITNFDGIPPHIASLISDNIATMTSPQVVIAAYDYPEIERIEGNPALIRLSNPQAVFSLVV